MTLNQQKRPRIGERPRAAGRNAKGSCVFREKARAQSSKKENRTDARENLKAIKRVNLSIDQLEPLSTGTNGEGSLEEGGFAGKRKRDDG